MGRLFDTTSNTSTIPKSTSGKGRLFATPVKKATIGEKVTNVAKGVTKFVGGEKLSEAIGGTIAMNKAPEAERPYIDLPTNKQTLASIGEVTLNVVPLGVGLGAGAKVATKVATSIPRLAAEGAAYGTAQGGLRAVQEGADVFSKETLKQSVVGGAIGGLAGGVIGGVGTVGRIFKNKKTPQQLFEEATQRANFKPIPDVGTPFDNIKPKTGIFDNGFTNLPKQTADINIQPGARFITPKVTPKTPLEIRAINNPNKSDFIGQEIQALQKTGQKVPVNTNKIATQAWDKMHPAPVQETIPKIKKVKTTEPKVETPTVAQAVPEQVKTEQPVVNTPEKQQYDNYRKEKLDEDPQFESGSNEAKIAKYDEVRPSKTNEQMIDYVTGKDKSVIEGLPKPAALNLLRIEAQLNPEKFTAKELSRLASNYAKSEGGALLQSAQVTRNGFVANAFDAITLANRDLQTILKKKGITKKNIINFLDDNQCTL